jgi:hypothetical protein
MYRNSIGRCAALLLSATAISVSTQSAFAQQGTHIDQKALLAQTRHAYYLPIARGVQGFSCTVSFDWPAVLERASGRKIPPKEPTLVRLKSATTTVTDDLQKGAKVKAVYPGGEPLPGSPVASRQAILNHLVTASLAGWNPFLSDQILPTEGTRYRFEAVPTGYRLTLDGGSFFSILDLDPQLRITHGESHLNGITTDFIPTFDPSTHGWLITSLQTATSQSVATPSANSSSSAPPSDEDKASFTFTYQFVDDILIPKRVTVQYAEGAETPFELKDCSLIKTAIPASKP